MNKQIYIVTHGAKNKGANPGLSEEGKKQVQALRDLLPAEPSAVVVGEGRRHGDTAKELGLWGAGMTVSSVAGGCGSLEIIGEQQMLYLADTTLMPFAQCTSGEDNAPAVMAKLQKLPDNAVICGGREILLALGMKLSEAKSGSVYIVEVTERGVIQNPQLATAAKTA